MPGKQANDGVSTADFPSAASHQFRTRACQGCVRSKTKCDWPIGPGYNACNRCARIKTNCVLPPLRTGRRRGPSTRVRKLEAKVDGLMSQLSAGGRQSPRPNDQATTQEPTDPHPEIQRHPTSPPPSTTSKSLAAPPSEPQSEATCIQIVPDFALTFPVADAVLDLYRTRYSPYFPFVPLPVTATAAELEKTSPLLLRTVLQVAAPQTAAVQASVERWFRQQIAHRVIVERERSLELLQALLVWIAWGDFQFYIESQATDLLYLTSTLILDLGLYKDPSSFGAGRLAFLPDAIRKVKGPANCGHTLEHMRATLGFTYLNSMVSTLFQRTESSMFTLYISHCCDTLAAAQEHDSDQFLVTLVRMQRIVDRVSKAFTHSEADDAPLLMDGMIQMVLRTARKELDALLHGQPSEVRQNVLFWPHYHGVLLKLYEPALGTRPALRPSDPQRSTARTEALSNCLQAAVDFFAAYANIPLENLGNMPLLATAYLAFAFVTSGRLLMLNDADWDAGVARRSFDFAAACQDLASRFRGADNLAESLGCRRKFKEDQFVAVLAAYSTKIQWVRQWYLAKVAAAGGGLRDQPTPFTPSSAITGSGPSHGAVPFFEMQDLDEAFWDALLYPEANSSLGS